MRPARQLLASLVLGLLMATSPSARSCAICAEIPGASGELGPRLVEVASAIRHELDSGGLDPRPGAALPTSGRGLGLRVMRLLEEQPGRNQSFELILIDSGARFRFDPDEPERGLVPLVSKEETPSSATRWITGLEVFHALLEGRIRIDTAEVRGILVVEALSQGDPGGEEITQQVESRSDQEAGAMEGSGSGKVGSAILLVILVGLLAMPVLLLRRSIRSESPTRIAEK